MCSLMYIQTALLCEQFIIHFAVKWTLSSVCAFMHLQITLPFEGFITHATDIYLPLTMHISLLVFVRSALLKDKTENHIRLNLKGM